MKLPNLGIRNRMLLLGILPAALIFTVIHVTNSESVENALLEFPGCAVVISHDRWFLDRVATHILAYEGESKWFWFEGNFESYETHKLERLGPEAARPHRVTYRKLTR